MSEENRLLRVVEAAEILGMSPSKVYEMTHSEGFPRVRHGKHVRIPLAALNRWIERNTEGDSPAVQPAPISPWTPPYFRTVN